MKLGVRVFFKNSPGHTCLKPRTFVPSARKKTKRRKLFISIEHVPPTTITTL